MFSRREMLSYGLSASAIAIGVGLTGCEIDPAKAIDAIKAACGLVVAVDVIAAMLKIDPTMSISALANVICTGFQTAKESGKLGASPAVGSKVKFDVVVGGQTIPVEATIVAVK